MLVADGGSNVFSNERFKNRDDLLLLVTWEL